MAGANKRGQYGFHARQVRYLLAHILELMLGQAAGFVAMRAVHKVQQFGDFAQAKTLRPNLYQGRETTVLLRRVRRIDFSGVSPS